MVNDSATFMSYLKPKNILECTENLCPKNLPIAMSQVRSTKYYFVNIVDICP